RRLCRDVGAFVVAVHYRRAPEHPFPAPYEDCLAVTRHVADHIDAYGARRDGLAVAGDSAGGNLAAVVAQAFRDEGRPLAAQLLAYPATDFDGDFPSRTENATGYVLTAENIEDVQYLYAGDDPAVRRSPQVSPLRAETFAGLAPAVIGMARYDPLRDEGLAYAEALEAAGVEVFVRTYDRLVHGFLNLFPVSAAADAATGELFAELGRRLGGAP
ncbi:alpha/beta hydrolase, partial [Streptomyces sp. UNOC14_S4]|uniref:alpha/beta hydrolase n=1 Tax=Streptomyces sp. UNOC14_S4 TaxID=2872340 RepID=UPI001E564DC6